MSVCEDCPAHHYQPYYYEAWCGLGKWRKGRGVNRGEKPAECINAAELRKARDEEDYALLAVPEVVARRMFADKAHVGEVVE